MPARALPILLLCCLLPGCSSTTTHTRTPVVRHADGCGKPLEQTPHDLQAYLSVERDGKRLPLCPGQDLHSTEWLWVTVEIDAPSYVRMIFTNADGEAGVVQRLDATGMTREANFRAPPGVLGTGDGDAQLMVVASLSPLVEADPMVHALLEAIRETGNVVDADGHLRPPPPGAEPAAIPMELGGPTRGLFADFDERGVAMLPVLLHTSR